MRISRKIVVSVAFYVLIFQASEADEGVLVPDYYKQSCPHAEEIVREHVRSAVVRDPRMAASLLRLHFHDCFVMGCDGSVLLDNSGDILSEKDAGPNLNSLRGSELVDKIKAMLEKECPETVSCADILAIAARDAVNLRGGPSWKAELGRRDSLKASQSGANQFIPKPNSSLDTLISSFQAQGLSIIDLVTLSGSHTIGKSRCLSFKQRLYDEDKEHEVDHHQRTSDFRRVLRSICPRSNRDDALVPLDLITSARFDNRYYINILQGRGLLATDNILVSHDQDGEIAKLVWAYASDQQLFFREFAASMLKMGSINPLTGEQGEIRRNCRLLNS
eukprot:TRINITY_DN12277_c1_g1_i2.p1 TRINITY_DN12277_c1_g1~~TRINITY_DN12277_c1_g1_i2.p1  ORF type:complete len:333 (-),score=55.77 TRINITY_DN12277_c1_g1_i2:60-1058(-)